jgi:hypothetical protein
MRDQYAGDVSDVLKFALLRALAIKDRALGIAWYYSSADDHRPDGRHREWRTERAWRRLDEALYAGLAALAERSVAALERLPIWPPGTLFHREPVPSGRDRLAWATRKRTTLEGADIVFLDPDNGVGAESIKHATFSEIRLLRRARRVIVCITFPHRNLSYQDQLEELHERIISKTGANQIATLKINVSISRGDGSRFVVQRQRWFTILDADSEVMTRVVSFAKAVSTVPAVTARLVGTRGK